MKYILAFILCAFLGANIALAQKQSILIKTSAQCSMCKERLEKSLSKIKGVEKATLNVDTKELSVAYNAQKTNDARVEALKSVSWLSAKPTGIVCHDVETSRQRVLGLGWGSFALAGSLIDLFFN